MTEAPHRVIGPGRRLLVGALFAGTVTIAGGAVAVGPVAAAVLPATVPTPDTTPPDTAPPDTAPPDTAPSDTAPSDTAPAGSTTAGSSSDSDDLNTTAVVIGVLGFVALVALAGWWMVRRGDPDRQPMPPDDSPGQPGRDLI